MRQGKIQGPAAFGGKKGNFNYQGLEFSKKIKCYYFIKLDSDLCKKNRNGLGIPASRTTFVPGCIYGDISLTVDFGGKTGTHPSIILRPGWAVLSQKCPVFVFFVPVLSHDAVRWLRMTDDGWDDSGWHFLLSRPTFVPG